MIMEVVVTFDGFSFTSDRDDLGFVRVEIHLPSKQASPGLLVG